MEIAPENIKKYLEECFGSSIRLVRLGEIGVLEKDSLKEFGYGKSLKVTFERNGREEHLVLSIMRGDQYGHQFYWDRAAILMFEFDTGARMEKHVKPLGLGYINTEGHLVPVKNPEEFFIVNELANGEPYFSDLDRIKKGIISQSDIDLARNLARWLARVHTQKKDAPDLYLRSIRQLIGDSECIWGLIDSYPYPYEHFSQQRFQQMEKMLINWRWKLRDYTSRLAVIHGDFHPWNVLISPDGDFSVLDRSRGEHGEPADDIASMSCNYLLCGLCQARQLSGDFERLYMNFWEEYLRQTDDYEILEVIAPFYVFRGLVIASPQWYPSHPVEVRQALFRFIENVLAEDRFDYSNINRYLD